MRRSQIKLWIALIVFLGISFNVSERKSNQKDSLLSFGKINLELTGVQQAFAGTAASWGFVRQSATWGRANSTLVDTLLTSLQTSGVFSRISSGELIVPNQTSSTGVTFTYRLKINENVSGIASTAYSGTKTYAHRFEAWKSGDSVPTLQMFFSSLTGTGTTGVLLYYNLSKLNPTAFGTATSAIVESYTSGNKGDMKQTYSWNNGPQDSSWISRNGRVIIREMNNGADICVRTVVTMNTNSSGLNGQLNSLCGSNTNIYYLLAYVQKTTAPFYTVAKSGLTNTTPIKNVSTFCGLAGSVSSALPNNYGLFDQNGFVSDGATSSTIPSGYPGTTDVDNAFSRTGAALNELGIDNVAVAEYDQSDATFMNNLSTNASLAFKTSSAPSCSQSFCINP
ncbi:MAG TPA: hypothetical protein PK079_10595 [Leptospiraceae bacterium]|nr:hypothetical protein [Leptospiraceae bacterium]HMW05919.1 hypothetical protein [Leptospiraceae bacterium]HMX32696.1 hypothetical protein [Leptospiraceae bacterium]HMY32716.1 hypothetical protein [Leptospiraceae bacterium]HMZ62524.1 hypothetical protein [Leptospiraceae bacterium]